MAPASTRDFQAGARLTLPFLAPAAAPLRRQPGFPSDSEWPLTPEAWSAVAGFLDRFGLPLVMLAVFAWAILKRKFVTGSELDKMTVLFERERVDRIAAEANLAKFAGANAEVAEAVREVLTEMVKPHEPRRGR